MSADSFGRVIYRGDARARFFTRSISQSISELMMSGAEGEGEGGGRGPPGLWLWL
jgi:hypothetical protein